MKSLTLFALILATATVIQADDNLLENYLKFLMPYVEPCAQEQKLSNDEATNIQMIPKEADMEKLACLRSCVMKRMGSLVDNKVQLDPVNAMIDTVHAGKPDEIPKVKQIASDCVAVAESQTSECQIGMKYADCYIGKLMGAN